MAHHTSLPQKRIFAEICQRSQTMASMDFRSKKAIWPDYSELYSDLQSHSPVGPQCWQSGGYFQFGSIGGRQDRNTTDVKKRKGAFWEDRSHATVIESGDHLLRCVVYIDMNMVRTGVVDHPEKWPYCGYNEIQIPHRKCKLIDYVTLS